MSIVNLNRSTSSSVNQAQEGNPVAGQKTELELAAEQFEAMFLQQVLKQMRKAGDVLAADNPLHSRDMDTMRDFYDGELANTLATKRQTGIADMLVKQLSGNTGEAESQVAKSEYTSAAMNNSFSPSRTWQRCAEELEALWDKGSAAFKSLVDSVINQESSGQMDAVSPKGALGLMQLMPETAREMAQELGIPFNHDRLIHDAKYNKHLGSAYLDKLLRRYDGEQALALAAYNAGPTRVDQWLERNGDPRRGEISASAWVERIPFQETRDYTRRILAEQGQRGLKSAPVPVAFNEGSQTRNSTGHWLHLPVRD